MTSRLRIQLLSFIAVTTLLVGCGRFAVDEDGWEKVYNQASLAAANDSYQKAEALRKQAVVDARGDGLEEVLSYGALAKTYREEGKIPEAINASKNGIRRALAAGGPDSINLATHLLVSLARLYHQQGQNEEITKLQADYQLPPLAPSPIADQQTPYLDALTQKSQKTWHVNPKKPGKSVSLLLILSPQAKERALIVVQSSGDEELDQAALDAVHTCLPYPAFPQRPEHSILGLLTFRTTAGQPTAPSPSTPPMQSSDQARSSQQTKSSDQPQSTKDPTLTAPQQQPAEPDLKLPTDMKLPPLKD